MLFPIGRLQDIVIALKTGDGACRLPDAICVPWANYKVHIQGVYVGVCGCKPMCTSPGSLIRYMHGHYSEKHVSFRYVPDGELRLRKMTLLNAPRMFVGNIWLADQAKPESRDPMVVVPSYQDLHDLVRVLRAECPGTCGSFRSKWRSAAQSRAIGRHVNAWSLA